MTTNIDYYPINKLVRIKNGRDWRYLGFRAKYTTLQAVVGLDGLICLMHVEEVRS